MEAKQITLEVVALLHDCSTVPKVAMAVNCSSIILLILKQVLKTLESGQDLVRAAGNGDCTFFTEDRQMTDEVRSVRKVQRKRLWGPFSFSEASSCSNHKDFAMALPYEQWQSLRFTEPTRSFRKPDCN